MEQSGTRPLVCPILVGRDEQRRIVQWLIAQVAEGSGTVALISGDAGIGKSRLAAEARGFALQRGFGVLQGNCFQPDIGSPYAPLLDMLRLHFVRRVPEPDDPLLGELLRLLPGILPVPPATETAELLDPEAHKRRLFAALNHFLSRMAARQPLLLLVEDLHWSDDGSLEFLHFLARQVSSLPLLLLLTYRSDEASPPLRRLLAQFDRQRIAHELPLTSLDRGEVGTMLRMIFDLDRPVRPEFLDVICPLTEGNPFFVEEVVQSLVVGGDVFVRDGRWDRKPMHELDIPRSVQDAVHQRVARLSPRSRAVLAVASVVGRGFDYALLAELAGLSEDELIDSIKELVAAQLVDEESADRLQFRHALIREAIYAELLTRERRTLHRRVAKTIRSMHGAALDAAVPDLARHYAEAGEWATAYEFARRAGEQAQRMYTPRAAIEQFTRALLAAGNLGLPVPFELYLQRGQAFDTLGDFEQARHDFETALALARDAEDSRGEWRALLELGTIWASRDYARTGEHYQQALQHARAIDDELMVAASLNRLGNWYVNVDQPHQGMRCHNEALDYYRMANDARGIAETHDLLGQASAQSSDAFAVHEHYRQAVAGFRALGDRSGLSSSLTMLAFPGCAPYNEVAVLPLQDRGELERGAAEALAIARDIGWRAGEAFAHQMRAAFESHTGQYGRALDHAEQSRVLAESIEHQQWSIGAHCVFGWIFVDLLDQRQALEHSEEAVALSERIGSGLWLRQTSAVLVWACILAGEIDRAFAVLQRADAVLQRADDTAAPLRSSGQRLCRYALIGAQLGAGQAAEALRMADELFGSTPHASPNDQATLPRLAELRGRALGLLGRWSDAEQALLAARRGTQQRAGWPLLWRVDCSLAGVYRSLGRTADAASVAAEARIVVAELAASIPDAEQRDGFLERAAGLIDRAAPRRRARPSHGGLTAREFEVAQMVARGLSNRAIADALVVSERTVETHVSNILGKLGAPSRARIVAWILELKREH